MIKFEKTVTPSPEQWEAIIRGMRNPKNSWHKMDSVNCLERDGCEDCPCNNGDDCVGHYTDPFVIGPNDHDLMMRLANGGPVHAKYRRMIEVYVDITAPLYWWKEFDTYKIGTVANSCSTMHKIQSKPIEMSDFSFDFAAGNLEISEKSGWCTHEAFYGVVDDCERIRKKFVETGDKRYWDALIQLLPSSYNQKRTVMMSYEVLVGIYIWRKNHKLKEWHDFCSWIETLPYSEIITGEKKIANDPI